MEPVTVTSSVRRTVRMAVALVIGQALLCALIGWVTLGSSRGDGGRTAGPIVDQLAAPPPAPATPAAPASSALTAVPQVVATTTTAAPRRTATRRPAASPEVSPKRQQPSPPPSPPPRSPSPARELTPPPGLINLPPPPSPPVSATPSPSGKVQEPVTVGERCRPEGAFGRTADGIEVRCLRSWHRGARWKIA